MSDRDKTATGAPRAPEIRLLSPYEDPVRRARPGQGFRLLDDPRTVICESPFALPRATTLSDDVTVVLAPIEPDTRPLDRVALPAASTHLVAEREEDPSIVCDPTDPEVLTNPLTLTSRPGALWVDTESSWAVPPEPRGGVLGRAWIAVAVLLAVCLAVATTAIIVTDGDEAAVQRASAQTGDAP